MYHHDLVLATGACYQRNPWSAERERAVAFRQLECIGKLRVSHVVC